MASLAIRQFEFRFYFHLFSVTLEARHQLESIKTQFSGIICLKEFEIYVLVRSISLDGEIELEGESLHLCDRTCNSTICIPKGEITAL